MNISKWFNKKFGKGDFHIEDEKLVYETEHDLIEANLPKNLKEDFSEQNQDNKSIKNDTKKEEVKNMTKKEEDIKKKDLKEDAAPAETMEAKFVKLAEVPDPKKEAEEIDKKHIDMTAQEKSKKIPEDGEEAGEMAAETPKAVKKKNDMDDIIAQVKEALKGDFEEEIKSLKAKVTDLEAKDIEKKQEAQEQLISDMANKYMVPTKWLEEKAKKYENTEDFIQDFYEGLSFAFGKMPEHEVEAYKGDMGDEGLLTIVEDLVLAPPKRD